MSKTEIIPIEGKLSHYRKTTNGDGRDVLVPVIDSRDGIVERIIALSVIKSASRSKYMSYNEYCKPRKTKKHDPQL